MKGRERECDVINCERLKMKTMTHSQTNPSTNRSKHSAVHSPGESMPHAEKIDALALVLAGVRSVLAGLKYVMVEVCNGGRLRNKRGRTDVAQGECARCERRDRG